MIGAHRNKNSNTFWKHGVLEIKSTQKLGTVQIHSHPSFAEQFLKFSRGVLSGLIEIAPKSSWVLLVATSFVLASTLGLLRMGRFTAPPHVEHGR